MSTRLQLYFAIGAALIILGRTIHCLVITRYLKSHGIEEAKGRWLRDWVEWKAYKAARLSGKQPIIWWYVLWAMQVLLLFWVAGWICNSQGWIRIDAPFDFAERAVSSSGYTTVFDVTQVGFREWTFSAYGLLFVAAGLAMRTLVRIGIFQPQYPWMMKWFPRLFVGFAIVWTLISFATTFADYRGAVSALQNNRARVVEGPVTEFKPIPYTGKGMESLSSRASDLNTRITLSPPDSTQPLRTAARSGKDCRSRFGIRVVRSSDWTLRRSLGRLWRAFRNRRTLHLDRRSIDSE